MTAKELIAEKLNQLNKPQLIKDLVLLKKWKRPTIDSSFSRGLISVKLAKDLQDLTSVHMAFWQDPVKFNAKGEKR